MFALNARTVTVSQRLCVAPRTSRCVRARAEETSTETPDKPIEKATGLPDSAKDSLKPRVEELRNEKFKKGTTDPQEIMKFDGVAPELVNGRLAMLGFAAALSAELVSHVSVFEQFKQAAGPIFVVGAIIALASIVPIVRGTDQLDDGAGEGIPGQSGIRPGFNLTNELINGRAAMFGLALLLIYEAGARGPLF